MTSAADFNAAFADLLPGHLGIQILEAERGLCRAELSVRPFHLAPNGFLHAGTVVTLADTACGHGCMASWPDDAVGFTTIELKSNHLATATEGALEVTAMGEHLGRTTQVWSATVVHRQSDRTLALFRCTQLVIYPR